MTERVRALNLTSGSMLTSQNATPTTLIGPPTLISSTFDISGNTTSTPAPSCTATLAPNGATFVSVCETSSRNTMSSAMSATTTAASTITTRNTDFSELKNEFVGAVAPISSQSQYHVLPVAATDITALDGNPVSSADITAATNLIMNSSQISTMSNESSTQLSQCPATNVSQNIVSSNINPSKPNGKHLTAQSVAGKSCRFPKLEDCAHFHYERVQLGPLSVRLVDDKSELLNSSIASQSIGGDIATSQIITGGGNGHASLRAFSPTSCWFIIKVFPHRCEPFLVKRSFENMQMLDEMLHRCVYDRKISGLKNLDEIEFKTEEDVEYAVAKYLERFSKIASDSLTCGTILTWLQLDNKGRRLPLADGDTQRTINTPAVGAAYGVRRYQAQAADEISIEVGDMISVIDMPSPAESIWWRGKKSHLQKSQYEVGFFPQSCVATIGDKVPRHFPMPAPLVGQLDVSPTKPVLRKHGKLIAFFRSFILSRPSRRRLKQSGIYRERVFSCDLSEHLLNSGQEIPMVLKCCAEFIEEYGIVDGIYRLSGITSNIQRLRRAFDEERIPDLGNPEMKQDIHAVSSLLKMYFRELPNPLCTYQLYDNFVEAIQAKSESSERLRLMKETVLKLPPPHYRTLKYLAEHLNKISQHSARTGMTDKNLAIVWAPNLLRSPALESGGVAALRGVGVQAVVTEYLIRNCNNIFDALDDCTARLSFIATAGATPAAEMRLDSLTDCESLLVEQREHDQSLTIVERPKSLSASGPKLISLEEAQERHSRVDGFDIKQSIPISMVTSNAANIGSYIEVGGGPSSLPDKYHTVLSVPRSWQKRKTHSWKSLFTRNQRPVSGNGTHEFRTSAGKTVSVDSTPLQRKEGTQVTFADADSIIATTGKGGKSSLLKQEKPKSIDLFETTRDINKPMEVCVRSNSIDSLRTAGHSRSVSHDSYFDLLQSPQRSHTNYPSSRELSELGLNFDREEPEMRIFSESESLVSSPRVGKENIPPSAIAASRRVMRARPEEFSSQTNSVNPSPKKQPRLNFLLSPSTASASSGHSHNWSNGADGVDGGNSCQEPSHLSSDESCCKRYKLEDQLSDIQYIDCGTPEHIVPNSQTLYTSVQVHAPPKPTLSKSTLYGVIETTTKSQDSATNDKSSPQSTGLFINTRYSYPSVQLGSKRYNQEHLTQASSTKDRFSYPGSNCRNNSKDSTHMHIEEEFAKGLKDIILDTKHLSATVQQSAGKPVPNLPPKPIPLELLRPKNRNSYCGSNEPLNLLLLRSNSADINKDEKHSDVMERSKISVTPSSPMQSPRYSLLVGETSSENSSVVNTPQYELDPLMIGSAMSGLSGVSGTSSNNQQQQQLLLDAASSYLATSRESLGSNITSHSNNLLTEKRDMNALKRELSLDLTSSNIKMTIDHNEGHATTLSSTKQVQQQIIPSPNNSNFTDNTSQSVTPSEFGYQHLQRQLSMRSLIETDENSPTYEDYENTPSNLRSPLSGHKLPSPIKSTISITYNIKSPVLSGKDNNFKPKTLLETSFDENIVYEQVKLLRDSVTEVNQLLSDEHKACTAQHNINEKVKLAENETINLSLQRDKLTSKVKTIEALRTNSNSFNNREPDLDVQMSDNSLDPNGDSEKLMYQNVQLRKPKSIYENVRGEEMKSGFLDINCGHDNILRNDDKPELDSLDSIETTTCDIIKTELDMPSTISIAQVSEQTPARKSPSNFSVKELANKFESSPVEQLPAFDFSVRSSIKKLNGTSGSVGPENKASQSSLDNVAKSTPITAPQAQTIQLKQKLNKSQQITRSLDENAFVREFGAKHLHSFANARSTQQISELTEMNNRRKSFDFTRPKTLNPPKRLPGMPITEEISNKDNSISVDYDYNNTLKSNASNISVFHEHDFESSEVKVTPTTENRISLIQNNAYTPNSSFAADLGNSNLNHSTNSLKVLSGVKLDRERIDKIKEERRQQLTQKYHTDSLKSRSKTDLNSLTKDDDKKFETESLRIKSKSRGDIRTLQKDIDNLKEFSRSTASIHASSESTLNTPIQNFTSQRVRSISDEKNQNCDTSTSITTATTTATEIITTTTATAPPATKTTAISYFNNDDLNVKKSVQNLFTAPVAASEEFSARATVQKFERKSLDFVNGSNGGRDRSNRSGGESGNNLLLTNRNSLTTTREKISPQFSIRDVTAMFESRSQNQQ